MPNSPSGVVFDCDTYETTLHSLATTLGMADESLRNWFARTDLPEYEDELFDDFSALLAPIDETAVSGTRCYHYTRVVEPLEFCETGLSSLKPDTFLDGGWATIKKAIGLDLDWDRLFQKLLTDRNYSRRHLVERVHWQNSDGPWAFFSRELIPYGDCCHYLRDGSELVVDALIWLEGELGQPAESLQSQFRAATTPCVVRFLVPGVPKRAQRCAITSLFAAAQCDEPWKPSYCYDGEGRSVPAEAIEAVEIVKDADIGRKAESVRPGQYTAIKIKFPSVGR